LSQLPWKIFVNNFTLLMGRISYSAYLIHFLVIKQVDVLFGSYFAPGNQYFLFMSLISVGATVPLSYISFKLIEEPCMRLAKKSVKALELRAVHLSTTP